jgi:hypothetical protein
MRQVAGWFAGSDSDNRVSRHARQYVLALADATALAKARPGSAFTLLDVTKRSADLNEASMGLVVIKTALRAEPTVAEAIV